MRKEGKEVFLFGSRGGIMVIAKCHKKFAPPGLSSVSAPEFLFQVIYKDEYIGDWVIQYG